VKQHELSFTLVDPEMGATVGIEPSSDHPGVPCFHPIAALEESVAENSPRAGHPRFVRDGVPEVLHDVLDTLARIHNETAADDVLSVTEAEVMIRGGERAGSAAQSRGRRL
jgi:hypothetical protein